MSALIRLDLVLREALERPYRDLVTRSTGAAVRNLVVTVLRATAERDALLDFSEVGVLDFSCADEVVAKLLQMFDADGLPVSRVLLRGLSEDHVDAIEHVLRHHGLVIVAGCVGANAPRILGDIDADHRAAFDALACFGRAPAAPVADTLAWPVDRARSALQALVGRRCVLAHPDATFDLGAVA